MNGLTRFSPRSDLRNLQREVDRVFDSFFRPKRESDEDSTSAMWSPRVDLAETDDAYHIHVDVPGMRKEDIDISFQNGELTVSGERRAETSETDEKRNYMRVERSYGRFYRSFALPNTVDIDKIEANYENGVLNISVPKAEEQKPRRIEVS